MAQRGVGSTETIMTAPVIRDVVVVGTTRVVDVTKQEADGKLVTTKQTIIPKGEFEFSLVFDGHDPDVQESPDSVVDRLYRRIQEIVPDAAMQHKADNYDDDEKTLLPDKRNNITRLITNEFFFYTKRPLTLAQFQQLMQKMAAWAAIQPENLHLILASFAVQTGAGVMNIVPVIQCGPAAKINFVAKSNPSDVDPVYTETAGSKRMLFNVSKAIDISKIEITINGKPHPISFDNIIACKTAEETTIHYVIDICLDHSAGVGMINFLEKLPHQIGRDGVYYSSVVVSGITPTQLTKSVTTATHADPWYSETCTCKEGVAVKEKVPSIYFGGYKPTFGTPETLHVLEPTRVSPIPTSLLYYQSRLFTFYPAKWLEDNRRYLAGQWKRVSAQAASEPERMQRVQPTIASVDAFLVQQVGLQIKWAQGKFDEIMQTETDPDRRRSAVSSVIKFAEQVISSNVSRYQVAQEAEVFKIPENYDVNIDKKDADEKSHYSTASIITDLTDSKPNASEYIVYVEIPNDDLDKVTPKETLPQSADEQSKPVDAHQDDEQAVKPPEKPKPPG